MSIYKYNDKTERVWDKSSYCYCDNEDCTPNNHRLCGICRTTILYGSHESERSQNNSRFSWNIDHIIPKSKGGTNSISNLQAVHIRCNRSKAN
ncbi:MAG: HNH endonuclease [Mycoplasma sp.]|nr:HNH endonuclease [Mycoplasma sp.]